MNREEATQKYGQTTINGINCGTVKGGFMPNACNERLLEQNIALNILIKKHPECLDALKVIDENYDSLNARETTSTPLQKDTDNKPQIIGKLSHHIKLGGRTPSEVFQSYGDIGIVPSEYFGILESEREACFCTSLARIYKYDTKAHPIRNMRSTLNKEGLFRGQFSRRSQDSPSEHVFFILDDQIYADIENNNFFALKQYPDDSKEQIDIKEQKFYSLSHEEQLLYKTLSSISHGVSNFEESEWFAYPGGIPSKYISGIVMDSELTAIDPNLSATLEKFFPQATIINIQDNSIIREPVIVHEQQ
ncbi:MAG: hypothetical protein ACI4L7_01795 [Christensenellales bacterium]